MKKWLVLFIMVPCCVSAQRINLSLLGTFEFGAKGIPNPHIAATSTGHAGGCIRGDIAFSFLRAGVGFEYSTYHSKGKVTNDYHNDISGGSPYPPYPRSSFDNAELYASGRSFIPYIYLNAGKNFFMGKLRIYGGLLAGAAIPNNKKAADTRFAFIDQQISLQGPTKQYLYTETKQPGVMYGLMVGVAPRLSNHFSIVIETGARRISHKSMATFNTVPLGYSSRPYSTLYYSSEIKYAFTYFPVYVGIKYTL